MTRRNNGADRQHAREARQRWEQAASEGRDHHAVGRMWESYLTLAHAANAFADLEREAGEAPGWNGAGSDVEAQRG